MSIQTRTVTEFKGTRTTDEQRARLQKAGFVHVTGLREYDQSSMECPMIGDKLLENERGKWNYHHGFYVIVTVGGEVWLGAKELESVASGLLAVALFRDLCPNGKGAFVPCANGSQLSTRGLLQRIADPSHGLIYSEPE